MCERKRGRDVEFGY